MFSKEPAAFPRSVALKKQKNKLTIQKSLKSLFFRALEAHRLAHRVRTGPEELSMKLGSKKIAISNLLVRLGSTFCHFFRTSVGRLLL